MRQNGFLVTTDPVSGYRKCGRAAAHGTADWLDGWAQDIFMTGTRSPRVILNYGVPAAPYMLPGAELPRSSMA
jgi:hypothetical protein